MEENIEITGIEIAESPKPARRRSSFAGDVLKLATGTAVAQALSLISVPILTRLFSPEAFGGLTIFTSIHGLLTVIVCLRYEFAIMLPERDQQAANLLGLSLAAAAIFSSAILPAVWLGGKSLAGALKANDIEPYLWFLFPTVLFTGFGLALNYWNSRTRRFGRLSIYRALNSGLAVVSQLIMGFLGVLNSGGLIFGMAFGAVISTTVLLLQIWRDDARIFLENIRLRAMLTEARRYKKFPLISSWSGLLNTLSWQMPAFLLSSFFSTTVVGYYGLSYRMLHFPMSLIGASIGQVFFQRASVAFAEGNLGPLVESTFRRLVMFGLFPFLALAFTGKEVFQVILGARWAEAGVYTQILSLWAFFWFISSPMSQLFNVLEKQEFGLWINVLLIITRFLSLYIGGILGDPRAALALFGGTGVLVYGYMNLTIMAKANMPWGKSFRIILENLALFLPAAGILMLVKAFALPPLAICAVTLVILGLYGLYVLQKDAILSAQIKALSDKVQRQMAR